MKIVVVGSTGPIGSKLVARLTELGHEAIAASPNTGVNTLTGEGLAAVFAGASVVVDVSGSRCFEDFAVLAFFQTSTTNLLAAEVATGVGHHVALSVVGTERMSDSGYFRAKVAQENLIKASSIPYSIVHATQIFEFIERIADEAAGCWASKVRLAPVLIQPMAADDVASAVAKTALGSPLNGTIEVAGPEQFRFDELIRISLRARNNPREVIADPHARYFGAELGECTLLPDDDARLSETRFEEWLNRSTQQPPNPLLGEPAGSPSSEPSSLKDNEFRVSDVPPGSASLVGEVVVFNVAGQYFATEPRCTHRQGPLNRGKLDGSTVTCPSHGAQFNVCTGAVLRGPATVPLKTHRVILDGEIGRVEVGMRI